eukprot:CAMPEP_0181453830 /NCGR_PEP_ID=MMETSP1110-20121109/29925_1 /TAXON_ID=174948 /ORGANISM="Symbiodinium sp., Strain CCMP421" /LENGTH=49 /DNA_ID=CAMNT_0023578157 /DNA_START=571 /DNA_END=720 /DNA_ORIENTATION=+
MAPKSTNPVRPTYIPRHYRRNVHDASPNLKGLHIEANRRDVHADFAGLE